MNLIRFALALAGLVATGTATAHSELYNADWCTGGFVIFRGMFTISPAELQAEFDSRQTRRTQCLQETGTFDGDDTCGIFDPPYELAVSMARAACGDPASRVPTQESPVTAFITVPTSFNEADHHTTFDFSSGLEGMCGYCEMYDSPPIANPPIANPPHHN